MKDYNSIAKEIFKKTELCECNSDREEITKIIIDKHGCNTMYHKHIIYRCLSRLAESKMKDALHIQVLANNIQSNIKESVLSKIKNFIGV